MSIPLPGMEALQQIASWAEQAGAILLEWKDRLQRDQVSSKSAARDLVTAADLASEEFLIQAISKAFPQDRFLAEESAGELADLQGAVWCIDPLDGTVNFVHGLPMFAVSIARLIDGVPDLAVVHLPRLGETFRAGLGLGAWLDDHQLQVSSAERCADAVLGTGFPYRRHLLADNNLENFSRMFLHQRGVRRMGSAASDMAYVAAGRLDAFWELHLEPWDVAAGTLLVREAGGVVEGLRQGDDPLFASNLVAGPAALVTEIRARLAQGREDSFPDLGDRRTP